MKFNYHADGTLPQNGEIFVFGSNLRGIHGAGAAKIAYEKYGAIWGIGVGASGRSFAIPTKNMRIDTMSVVDIIPYINQFVDRARRNPQLEYFVTRIGCGLAGYEDKDIAPLFRECTGNCNFAESWKEYLE